MMPCAACAAGTAIQPKLQLRILCMAPRACCEACEACCKCRQRSSAGERVQALTLLLLLRRLHIRSCNVGLTCAPLWPLLKSIRALSAKTMIATFKSTFGDHWIQNIT
eukprot:3149801-Pleurochrysis_carterae.AAC.4